MVRFDFHDHLVHFSDIFAAGGVIHVLVVDELMVAAVGAQRYQRVVLHRGAESANAGHSSGNLDPAETPFLGTKVLGHQLGRLLPRAGQFPADFLLVVVLLLLLLLVVVVFVEREHVDRSVRTRSAQQIGIRVEIDGVNRGVLSPPPQFAQNVAVGGVKDPHDGPFVRGRGQLRPGDVDG